MLVNFGANDEAVLRVLFGEAEPKGRLPIQLPSSMEAVERSRPDVPSDTPDPAFAAGFGLRYIDWVPQSPPTVEEKAASTITRPQGNWYRIERTTVGLLLKDPEATAILTEDLPELFSHPMLNVSLGMAFPAVMAMVAPAQDEHTRRQLLERLRAL